MTYQLILSVLQQKDSRTGIKSSKLKKQSRFPVSEGVGSVCSTGNRRIIFMSIGLDDLLNNQQIFSIDEDTFYKNIEGNVYKRQYARYLLLRIEYLLSDNTVHLSGYDNIRETISFMKLAAYIVSSYCK
jgi:hypothetical protein